MATVVPDTITNLPVPPSTGDPDNFDPRADAFLTALPTLVTEVNTVSGQTYQNAQWAESKASEADTDAASAAASEASAMQHMEDAAAYAGAVVWTNIAYTAGAVRWSPITRLSYRRINSGTLNQDPSIDTTNWVLASVATPQVVVVTGTTATAINNREYVLTNAAITTVTAPASPSTGHTFWVRVANGRFDNQINFGAAKVNGLTTGDGILVLADQYILLSCRYINATYGWSV